MTRILLEFSLFRVWAEVSVASLEPPMSSEVL